MNSKTNTFGINTNSPLAKLLKEALLNSQKNSKNETLEGLIESLRDKRKDAKDDPCKCEMCDIRRLAISKLEALVGLSDEEQIKGIKTIKRAAEKAVNAAEKIRDLTADKEPSFERIGDLLKSLGAIEIKLDGADDMESILKALSERMSGSPDGTKENTEPMSEKELDEASGRYGLSEMRSSDDFIRIGYNRGERSLPVGVCLLVNSENPSDTVDMDLGSAKALVKHLKKAIRRATGDMSK